MLGSESLTRGFACGVGWSHGFAPQRVASGGFDIRHLLDSAVRLAGANERVVRRDWLRVGSADEKRVCARLVRVVRIANLELRL